MVVRRPELMESTWTSFTSELGPESWITTLSLIILVPLVLVFVTNHSPFEEWKVPFQDAYVLTVGALSFQGSWINVSSTSSRVVCITIFLATLLIYAHYTSALVAQLTVVSESSTPFTTLQGLMEDGSYKLDFSKGTSLLEFFKESKSSPYKGLWNDVISKDEDNMPKDLHTGLEKVKKERYVFIMEANSFNFGYYRECEVMLLPKDYFKTITGLALAKDSPYAKAFNYQLSKMRDTGIMDRFWNRWKSPKSLCTSIPFVALSIDQTFTAFLVLLVGLILATIVCLPLERTYWSSKKDAVTPFNIDDLIGKKNEFNHPFNNSIDDGKTGTLLYSTLTPRTNFG